MAPSKVKVKATRANRKCLECNRIVATTGLTAQLVSFSYTPSALNSPQLSYVLQQKHPPHLFANISKNKRQIFSMTNAI